VKTPGERTLIWSLTCVACELIVLLGVYYLGYDNGAKQLSNQVSHHQQHANGLGTGP
jgi:hypothetical protein